MSIDTQTINTIRSLSIDAIQQAKSGHPGLPLGVAPVAYTIWQKHLRFDPRNPNLPNRDRFILSAGHGSALLYSLLHLYGYDLSLDDLKAFRQWGSKTPGHPEYKHTAGVEMTTGPLGQGFATGVGMAIGQKFLAKTFDETLFNYTVYGIVSDGDLMEGISSEAASLAGHLKLDNMIYLYDDNAITIDGSCSLSFSEDVTKRFEAYGWLVLSVDGYDLEGINNAIQQAKNQTEKPTLIRCKTIIGYGSPNKQGTSKVHGSPLGSEELLLTKEALRCSLEPFFVPEEVAQHTKAKVQEGKILTSQWEQQLADFSSKHPEKARSFVSMLNDEITDSISINDVLDQFTTDGKAVATRSASGKTLQALAKQIPTLIGGSADLAPSNNTFLKDYPAFSADNYGGRNFHFGIREFGMGTTLNGLALTQGIKAYGGTFLVFSDYMRSAIRSTALMQLPVTYVFTHDSIGLGEDGPTHQPIEHIMSLRGIPNLQVVRPADAYETAYAWKIAVQNKTTPTVLALSRQNLPLLTREKAHLVEKGAYVLLENTPSPEVLIIATGSEVSLAVEAYQQLVEQGKKVRVVSMPCWELFAKQDKSYQESVLPSSITARISIEAGITLGWERYVGDKGIAIGIDHFGASAPADILYEKFGITVEAILVAVAKL
jgi:transketolase